MTGLSTLCYITRHKDGKKQVLMLHRTIKPHDVNHGKWIGVGGHFEANESPDECLLREVYEETGYTLTSWQFRGIVTFVSGDGVTEYMHLFTADGFTGTPHACDEGVLKWVDSDAVWRLNLWEGDRVFFRLMLEETAFFSLKLVYDGHDRLVSAIKNGSPLELLDILDEDGSKTGIVRERGVAHRDGSLHGTVHIWIVRRNADGVLEVLLQKRAMQKDSNPGAYDISSAGHISSGDEPLPSALRELHEEIGIAAKPADLTYLGHHRGSFTSAFHGHPFVDNEYSTLYLYTKPVDIKQLKLQPEEVESVKWMPVAACHEQIKNGTLQNCIYESEFAMIEKALNERDF